MQFIPKISRLSSSYLRDEDDGQPASAMCMNLHQRRAFGSITLLWKVGSMTSIQSFPFFCC